jgi:hypothetical protein
VDHEQELTVLTRSSLADLWRECAQIERRDIFGDADILRPTYPAQNPLVRQVDTPAVGMVGPRYHEHGTVLLSVNPAGGRPASTNLPSSDALYRAFADLRAAVPGNDSLQKFERMNAAFEASLPDWRIVKQYIDNILDALGIAIHETAYLYLVPFRTRDDKGSTMNDRFLCNGFDIHLRRQLDVVLPSLIVAVDRPSERFARQWTGGSSSCEVCYFTRKRDAHSERRTCLEKLRLRSRR